MVYRKVRTDKGEEDFKEEQKGEEDFKEEQKGTNMQIENITNNEHRFIQTIFYKQ